MNIGELILMNLFGQYSIINCIENIDVFKMEACCKNKIPLNTDAIVTKVIDGDSTCNDNFASGTSIAFAIVAAPKNNIKVPANPINPKVTRAILNILCAPL